MPKVITRRAAVVLTGEVLERGEAAILPRLVQRALAQSIVATLAEFNKRGPRWTWAPVGAVQVQPGWRGIPGDSYRCLLEYQILPR